MPTPEATETFVGDVGVRDARFYKLVDFCRDSSPNPNKVRARFRQALPRVPPLVGRNRTLQLSEAQMLLDSGRPFPVPRSAASWDSVRRKLNRLIRRDMAAAGQ